MKIIIVGCGYVGGALADRARAAGHEVWAVRRNPGTPPAPGVHMVRGDVVTGAGLAELPRDADALVYAVAPDQRSDEAYRAAYPEGMRRVLASVPMRRLLVISSTAVYGETRGGWVDDDTPAEPKNFAGQRICAAEQLAVRGVSGAVIVRASGIYGPGRTGLLERVRQGVALTPEDPVFTNRVHRDDLAGILLFLMGRPALAGVFLASDAEPAELGQLHTWLAAQLAVPKPPVASGGLLRARHRSSKRCLPRRLLAEGYEFTYPSFREGYTALLERQG